VDVFKHQIDFRVVEERPHGNPARGN
jgi:hypothetical protein